MIRPAISSGSPRRPSGICGRDLSWDSPDDSRTGVNIIAFPSSLEDRREVRTATGTLGQPERWSSGRSGHFPWHWHGSIRRDCLDHVIVPGDRHLRHLLKSYQKYYNEARTHLTLHHALNTAQGRADPARGPDRRSHTARANLGRTTPRIYPSVSFRQGHRPYPVDLCETPFNERFDQLYAAQQALAWAANPEQRESPLDMINRFTVWHWGRFRRLSC